MNDKTAGIRDRIKNLSRNDHLAALLGIQCIDAGPGQATARMVVRQEHLNFLGGCHGAALFALADHAFGLASNSHGTVAVGIDTHMAFAAGAVESDVLTATAEEVSQGNRTALYRIVVTHEDGRTLVTFTGTVYRTGKPLSNVS